MKCSCYWKLAIVCCSYLGVNIQRIGRPVLQVGEKKFDCMV